MSMGNIITGIIAILILCSPFALLYWLVKKMKKYIGRKNNKSSIEKDCVQERNNQSLSASKGISGVNSKTLQKRLSIVDDRIARNYTNEEMISLGFDPFLRIKAFLGELKTNVTYSDHDGRILFDRTFTALEMGCERIGDYLLIQFARSEGDDAFKLYFIDLLNDEVIFSVYPDFSWDEIVSYDGAVLTVKNQYGDFEINNSGELVDKITYLKAVAASYSSESIGAISTLFNTLEKNEENISFYHSVLDECFLKLQSEFHALNYLSSLLKLKGEIYEYQNDYYNSYRVYSLGLKLNPKLSVRNAIKRALKQLRQNTIDSIDKYVAQLSDYLILKNKKVKKEELNKSRVLLGEESMNE